MLSRTLAVAFLLIALVAGADIWLQREVGAELRTEIGLQKAEHRDIAGLRAENARLQAAQPSPETLERLRADHSAVARMRGEMDSLKADLQKREQRLAAEAAAETARIAAKAPEPPPALILPVAMKEDGAITVDGAPMDMAAIKQRLATIPRGQRVEIRLNAKQGAREQTAVLNRSLGSLLEALKPTMQELGIKMTLILVPQREQMQ